MKKKYQQPLIKVLSVEGESLLNGGSAVTYQGDTEDTLDSDTSTGGTADEGGTVWGDAKPNNSWWD